MTDTQLLNWVSQNLTALRGLPNETVEIDWLDTVGYPRRTVGRNLRDCILKAVEENRTPLNQLGDN